MRVDRERGWSWVDDERVRLAELLGGLRPEQWDVDSLCDGWRVRDVVGHLVWLAEGTRRSIVGDVVWRRTSPNRAIAHIGREIGANDPSQLIDRLRAAAGGRFVVPGAPSVGPLGDVLTHRADITVALGLGEHPADERMQAVIAFYRRIPFMFGTTWRAARLRYVATDGGWGVGRGPEVRGTGETLLLALTSRPVAAEALGGPGAPLLLRQS